MHLAPVLGLNDATARPLVTRRGMSDTLRPYQFDRGANHFLISRMLLVVVPLFGYPFSCAEKS
jgi:hypothetical protein